MIEKTNVGAVISQIVGDTLSQEFIEAKMKERVEKLVVDAVDSSLRTYSPTGKLIEEAVAESLRVTELNLPSYGQTVTQILRQMIDEKVSELVAGRLKQDMDDMLNLAPKTIKLSQIVKEMVIYHRDDHGHYAAEQITAIIERTEYGSVWVYLDENANYDESSKYRCDTRLLIGKDGLIAHMTLDQRDVSKSKIYGKSYGLNGKVVSYYACGTVIEIDEDQVDQELSTDC